MIEIASVLEELNVATIMVWHNIPINIRDYGKLNRFQSADTSKAVMESSVVLLISKFDPSTTLSRIRPNPGWGHSCCAATCRPENYAA
jgi:hypothetical protein